MSRVRLTTGLIALLVTANAALLQGCAVGGWGNDSGYGSDVRIGLDYYEPWFGDYGGWGPGYRVGPPRQVWPQPGGSGGFRPSRGFRPAPAAHPVPSIPSRPRAPGRRDRR